MNLVTGTSSGLGKFLCERLNGQSYSRLHSEKCLITVNQPFDAIIHCAFNINKNITSKNFTQYINDTINLTQTLLSIPHKKFIFISTSDVYPRNPTTWKEEDEFLIEKVEELYGVTKLIVESLIKNEIKNYLIPRPTALLGMYSRPNSLIKILNGETSPLTLHQTSIFNYILHQDVLEFICIALKKDLCGTYNLAASKAIKLEEIAEYLNRDIKFGSYVYKVANVCNQKAIQVCNVFSHSSLKNIERFRTIMGV